ncbi:hypothetical protein ABZ470_23805 [Streptosporangium sp. NPDC020072]|uniref:hypothetical protein n=1 Tax=Streptosporangium sp. NPDC020072 TaxID=3154788 RepID=UPI00341A0D99
MKWILFRRKKKRSEPLADVISLGDVDPAFLPGGCQSPFGGDPEAPRAWTSEEIVEHIGRDILPSGLLREIYAVSWATDDREGVRIYHKSGGIRSALTQLGLKEDGRVWVGEVTWREVTDQYRTTV